MKPKHQYGVSAKISETTKKGIATLLKRGLFLNASELTRRAVEDLLKKYAIEKQPTTEICTEVSQSMRKNMKRLVAAGRYMDEGDLVRHAIEAEITLHDLTEVPK